VEPNSPRRRFAPTPLAAHVRRYPGYIEAMTQESPDHRNVARKLTLAEDNDDGLVLDATPAERLQMVWPLTCDCWGFLPDSDAQLEFQRHVEHVQRGKR